MKEKNPTTFYNKLKRKKYISIGIIMITILIHLPFAILIGNASTQLMPRKYILIAYIILCIALIIFAVLKIPKGDFLNFCVTITVGIFNGMVIVLGISLILRIIQMIYQSSI